MTAADAFSEQEVAHCKAAMSKPAPLEALALIASGRVVIVVSEDRRDVYIDQVDGRPIRDSEHPDRLMGFAGARPLYRAGMIDQFGIVTAAGRAALQSTEGGMER